MILPNEDREPERTNESTTSRPDDPPGNSPRVHRINAQGNDESIREIETHERHSMNRLKNAKSRTPGKSR
jgi:hypothetical protein